MITVIPPKRWGGRAVECAGFENLYGRNAIASSNLAPTALAGRIPFHVIITSRSYYFTNRFCYDSPQI